MTHTQWQNEMREEFEKLEFVTTRTKNWDTRPLSLIIKHFIEKEKAFDFFLSSFTQRLEEIERKFEKEKRGTKNYDNSHEALMNSDKDYGYNRGLDTAITLLGLEK